MIIYNITISVEKEIVQEWLDWMQKKHIPQVMSTGCFFKAQINKVLALDDSEETYAIAYTCIDKKNFDNYQKNYASLLQKEYLDLYANNTFVFRTVMKKVKEF